MIISALRIGIVESGPLRNEYSVVWYNRWELKLNQESINKAYIRIANRSEMLGNAEFNMEVIEQAKRAAESGISDYPKRAVAVFLVKEYGLIALEDLPYLKVAKDYMYNFLSFEQGELVQVVASGSFPFLYQYGVVLSSTITIEGLFNVLFFSESEGFKERKQHISLLTSFDGEIPEDSDVPLDFERLVKDGLRCTQRGSLISVRAMAGFLLANYGIDKANTFIDRVAGSEDLPNHFRGFMNFTEELRFEIGEKVQLYRMDRLVQGIVVCHKPFKVMISVRGEEVEVVTMKYLVTSV